MAAAERRLAGERDPPQSTPFSLPDLQASAPARPSSLPPSPCRYDDMEKARSSGVGLAFDQGSLCVDEVLEGYSAMYSRAVEIGDKLVFVQGVPAMTEAQFHNFEFARLFGQAMPGRQGTFVKMEFLCSSPRSADVEDTLYSKDFSLSWDRKMYNIQLMRGSRLYLLLASRRRLLEQTIEEFELLNEKLRGLLGMKTFNPPSVSMTTEELIRSVYVKKDMISHQLERVNVNEIFGVYDRETNSVMGQTRDYTMQVVPRLGGPYTYINSLTESQVAARMQELPNAQSAFAWLKKERMEQETREEIAQVKQRCKELRPCLDSHLARLKKLENQRSGMDVSLAYEKKSARMKELERLIGEAKRRQEEVRCAEEGRGDDKWQAIREFEQQHKRRQEAEAEARREKLGIASRA